MIPIQDLLNRIRWDRRFADARFELDYYDRVERRLVRVALRDIQFPSDSHVLFELVDDRGQLHSIPLHRIRDVYRNGQRIWQRPLPGRQ